MTPHPEHTLPDWLAGSGPWFSGLDDEDEPLSIEGMRFALERLVLERQLPLEKND